MRQQHRLYRDAQNDYWEARSRRARRIMTARKSARVSLSILIVAVVLGTAAIVLNGKAGDIIHRVKDLAGGAAGPAIEPEQQVENSINRTAGASVYTVTAKAIEAMYQPGNGSDYFAICINPQGVNNDIAGEVSVADLGGWDCILVNGLTAILGASLNGGADWTSLSDIEPYLAADSVTRQFADATGGTFVPA